jgi:deoxyadenosine/deoxycytidine kinase
VTSSTQRPIPQTIIVEGIIGAGKTEFSEVLARCLHTKEMPSLYITEPDDVGNANPFLTPFYSDRERWAYTAQTFLLGKRLKAHKRAQDHVMCNIGFSVVDRSYYGDVAFAYLQKKSKWMTEDEFLAYAELYHVMTSTILYPDIVVHLKLDPVIALERVRRRMVGREGRQCEAAITLEYLNDLDQMIGDIVIPSLQGHGTKVFEVPWDEDLPNAADRVHRIQQWARVIKRNKPRMEFPSIFDRKTASMLGSEGW